MSQAQPGLSSKELIQCLKCYKGVYPENVGETIEVTEVAFSCKVESESHGLLAEFFLRTQIGELDGILVQYHENHDIYKLSAALQSFMVSACMHNTHQRSRQDRKYPEIVFRCKCANLLLRVYDPEFVFFPRFAGLCLEKKVENDYLHSAEEQLVKISKLMKITSFEDEHISIIMTTIRLMFNLKL
jgi:hypothetical protein